LRYPHHNAEPDAATLRFCHHGGPLFGIFKIANEYKFRPALLRQSAKGAHDKWKAFMGDQSADRKHELFASGVIWRELLDIDAERAERRIDAPHLHHKFVRVVGVHNNPRDGVCADPFVPLLQEVEKLALEVESGAADFTDPRSDRGDMKQRFLT